MSTPEHGKNSPQSISRRDFIKYSGMAVAGMYCIGCNPDGFGREKAEWGFILVDTKKCQGCKSCMLACSMVHDGSISLSTSRIQVFSDPYGCYPDDIEISQCRQCVSPACMAACPTGALARDPANGNVLTVDPALCNGCKICLAACAWSPARCIWSEDASQARKCDLCSAAAHWDEAGGPDGKKACVEVCPMQAITFSKVIPAQDDPDSYTVNLRNRQWGKLGYPRF